MDWIGWDWTVRRERVDFFFHLLSLTMVSCAVLLLLLASRRDIGFSFAVTSGTWIDASILLALAKYYNSYLLDKLQPRAIQVVLPGSSPSAPRRTIDGWLSKVCVYSPPREVRSHTDMIFPLRVFQCILASLPIADGKNTKPIAKLPLTPRFSKTDILQICGCRQHGLIDLPYAPTKTHLHCDQWHHRKSFPNERYTSGEIEIGNTQ